MSACIEVVKAQREIGIDHMHGMLGSKGIFILISFIIVILIVDTSVVKISAFIGGLTSPASSVTVFTTMAIIFSVGQYLILSFVRTRIHAGTQYDNKLLNRLYKLVVIIQYALIVILGALILQMVLTSSYNTIFLEVVIWINYVLAIGLNLIVMP